MSFKKEHVLLLRVSLIHCQLWNYVYHNKMRQISYSITRACICCQCMLIYVISTRKPHWLITHTMCCPTLCFKSSWTALPHRLNLLGSTFRNYLNVWHLIPPCRTGGYSFGILTYYGIMRRPATLVHGLPLFGVLTSLLHLAPPSHIG